jgi:hypothetical protein
VADKTSNNTGAITELTRLALVSVIRTAGEPLTLFASAKLQSTDLGAETDTEHSSMPGISSEQPVFLVSRPIQLM